MTVHRMKSFSSRFPQYFLKKYFLFLLAAVSHFAYNFCFGISFLPFQTTVFNQTGVVWSLAWGLVLLYIHDQATGKAWQKNLATIAICLITFPSDWSCIATMSILAIGMNQGNLSDHSASVFL
ncbi:MAG: hypothetical protein NC416_10455 [Eubacterium sp.]|nr:hypothetical protein [Eubacterium sp.]